MNSSVPLITQLMSGSYPWPQLNTTCEPFMVLFKPPRSEGVVHACASECRTEISWGDIDCSITGIVRLLPWHLASLWRCNWDMGRQTTSSPWGADNRWQVNRKQSLSTLSCMVVGLLGGSSLPILLGAAFLSTPHCGWQAWHVDKSASPSDWLFAGAITSWTSG